MTIQLIRGYDMKLATPDCLPNAEHYRASVTLREEITEALPYLNAELEGAEYHHDTKVLLWNSGGKKYAFRPREIAIAPVHDREEAEKLVLSIVHTVNEIWTRKDNIIPSFEGKKPLPNVLDIYKLLPRTNCRECGYLSCMAFAAALRSDPLKVSLCSYYK
ncbi:MAG: (Fe-S)-binding protein [Chlamydiota bacterium]